MIDCKVVQENLSAYIDDELSADKKEQISHHLQTCRDCHREYLEFKITASIMHSLDLIEPPPGLQEQVTNRLLAEANKKPVSGIKKRSWYSFGAVAAGLLLLVSSWSLILDNDKAKNLLGAFQAQDTVFEASSLSEEDKGNETVEAQPFALADSSPVSMKAEEALPVAPAEDMAGSVAMLPTDSAMEQPPAEETEIQQEANGSQGISNSEEYQGARSVARGEVPAPVEERSSQTRQGTVAEDFDVELPESGSAEEMPVAPDELDKDSIPSSTGDMNTPAPTAMMMGTSVAKDALELALEVKTHEPAQTYTAIERIAQNYELEYLSQENDQEISLEIYVPISRQEAVVEELSSLGYVTHGVVSDRELAGRISKLLDRREELEQQQIELRALLHNGGTAEVVKVWEEELSTVNGELEKIKEELNRLEVEFGPTCIKVVLVKQSQ